MDDFFSTLGKRISDTVDEFGKKAEDTLEIQKLKGDIYSLKRENSRDFADIGKKVYEHFKNAEEVGEEYLSFCEEIEKREEKIQELNRTISRIKGCLSLFRQGNQRSAGEAFIRSPRRVRQNTDDKRLVGKKSESVKLGGDRRVRGTQTVGLS